MEYQNVLPRLIRLNGLPCKSRLPFLLDNQNCGDLLESLSPSPTDPHKPSELDQASLHLDEVLSYAQTNLRLLGNQNDRAYDVSISLMNAPPQTLHLEYISHLLAPLFRSLISYLASHYPLGSESDLALQSHRVCRLNIV